MKLLLTIDEPGYFINIPGVCAFRTPIKIDVTHSDLNLIIIELKKLGIDNYKIKSVSDEIKKPKKKKIKKENDSFDLKDIHKRFNKIEDIIKNIPSQNEPDISGSDKKFNVIENLLNDIIKSNLYKKSANDTSHHIEKDVGYIPSVDISDTKISGKSTFKTKKIDSNLNEKSNSLAKFIKK